MFYKETNFKETPIGRVPKDWEVVKLGDRGVAEIRGNKIVSNIEKVAFIPMEFVPDQEIFTKYEIRSLKDVSSSTYCEAGDLLLAKITPSLENGKQGIVPENIPNGFALATTEVYPIVCKGIDRLLLFYILKFPKFRKILEFSMRGTTGRQRVPKEAVEKLRIPLPPLPEQRKIAEVLSAVDEAIRRTGEVIAKTERLKKGLMQTLLTRGIGHKEFKDTEIGRIPKEWKITKLRDVVKRVTDILSKEEIKRLGAKYVLYSIPAYHEKGKPELVKAEEIGSTKFLVQIGDILFGKINPKVPKVWVVEHTNAIASTEFIVLRPDKGKVVNRFLYYLLQTDRILQSSIAQAKGAVPSRLRTDIGSFMQMSIQLPSIEEQEKIAEILSNVDKKLELERNEKAKLERIKQGLMDLLLTGKIRVKVG
ncbi:MAG: restriction endonuclease subunit S [Nitrososphaerota archaeon]